MHVYRLAVALIILATPLFAENVTVSLKSAHGKYLVALPNGAAEADRKQASTWEKWVLANSNGGPLVAGSRVTLLSAHNRYLVSEKNGSALANREVAGPWETWVISGTNGGSVGHCSSVKLRGAHGGYLVAESNGRANSNRQVAGPWEHWTIEFEGKPPCWQIGPELFPGFYEHVGSLAGQHPTSGEVEYTFYEAYSFETVPIATHVQGLGWSGSRNHTSAWAITHNAIPIGPSKSILMLCNDPTIYTDSEDRECWHHRIGDDVHGGGGTQIIGDVLVTSDEGKAPILYDIRDLANPVPLACRFPSDYGGAAGLAWYDDLNVHVAVFGSGGSDRLLVSNGRPLDSDACIFTPVATENPLGPPGEGMSQLFYDRDNKLLVSLGGSGDDNGDNQKLFYQRFRLERQPSGAWSVVDKQGEVSIPLRRPSNGYGPNLRWGGTARMYDNGFDVVLAANTLSGFRIDPDLQINVYNCSACSENSSGLKVMINSVHCIETTESTGEDEVYLTTNSGVRLPAGNESYHDINDGETWHPNLALASNSEIKITLMEYDTSNDRDQIGEIRVQVSKAPGSYSETLEGDDGKYKVSYEVHN
ncbi:MAG: hypothetical protein AAFQ38_16630 [Pseudomonadota bacterium]